MAVPKMSRMVLGAFCRFGSVVDLFVERVLAVLEELKPFLANLDTHMRALWVHDM